MPSPLRLRLVARWPRSLRGSFTALSMGGHLLALLVLIVVPSLRARPRLVAETLTVDLVTAVPAAGARARPAAQLAAPAPPVKPKPAKAAVPLPDPDKPRPAPTRKPAKVPPPQPAPEPEPETGPAAEPSKPASTVGPAVGDAGGAVAAFEFGGTEFAWYRTAVSQALYSQWRKPILDGMAEPVEVTVTFEILRDGRVADVRIDGSSGVPSLDRSALRAVADAAPLPPLPRSWDGELLPARFVFRLLPGEEP